MTAAAPLRRVRVLLSTNYALMLEYRAELFLWAVSMSLPLIVMGVWVEAGSDGRFTLTPAELARYFVAVFIVRNMTVVWVIHEFEHQVVSGRLSPLLLHPMDPGWRFVSAHIGEQLARLPFAAALVGLALIVFPEALRGGGETGPWRPAWTHLLLALPAIYAAFALRFLMQYTVALLSFWMERVEKLDALVFLPYIFLSGTLAPLQEFDAPVREVVMWTPFPYTVWYPAMLLVDGDAAGLPHPLRAAGIVAAWVVGLWLVNRWLWRRGLAHYSAMGA